MAVRSLSTSLASGGASDQRSSAFSTRGEAGTPLRVVLVVLALAAPAFALASWPLRHEPSALLQFSLPIMLAQLAIVVAALLSGVSIPSAIAGMAWPTRIAGPAFLAVAVWASLVAARGVPEAPIYLFGTMLHVLFALVLWEKLRGSWSNWRALALFACGIGGALYLLAVMVLLPFAVRDPAMNWDAFAVGAGNVRQIGFYGLAAGGVGTGMMAAERRAGLRGWWFALATAGWWLVVLSGGRMAFMGLLLASGLSIVFANRGHRFVHAGLLAGALALGTAGAALSAPDQDHWGAAELFHKLNPSADREDIALSQKWDGEDPEASALYVYTTGRMGFWQQSFDIAMERPLLGHGQGVFKHAVPRARGGFNHPHSAPLQFLFEWGIVGSLCLAVLLAGPALRSGRALLRAASARRDPALCTGVVTLSGLVVMAMGEGAFFHPYPIMVALVCMAVIATARGDARLAQGGS